MRRTVVVKVDADDDDAYARIVAAISEAGKYMPDAHVVTFQFTGATRAILDRISELTSWEWCGWSKGSVSDLAKTKKVA